MTYHYSYHDVLLIGRTLSESLTTQIWEVTRHQYQGISAFVPQTPFCGGTAGGVEKCRLFSQANLTTIM